MHIVLLGEPKSTSHIYKYRVRGKFVHGYMSKKGRELKLSYKKQAKKQYKKSPLTGPLEVTVMYYFGTKRACDPDNFFKLVLDSLNGLVWVDDSQIRILTAVMGYDKENPRAEVIVKSDILCS